MNKCPTCHKNMSRAGLLYRCSTKTCETASWDKIEVLERIKNFDKGSEKWKQQVNKILLEAGVELELRNKYYVYQLKMTGELKPRARLMEGIKLYVGETGLHPIHRYLHHILGYNTTTKSKAQELASSLVKYEGPYETRTEAKNKEKETSVALHKSGHEVYGNGLEKKFKKERDKDH